MVRRCDFCMEPGAGWVLPVEDFTLSTGRDDVPDHSSVGDWQCCSGWAALIRSDDWDGLARRALAAAHIGGHLEDPELEVFEAIHRAVRVHATGPVRLDRS